MRINIVFFLILFIAYIATPPIVNYIDTDGDFADALFMEEENTKDNKLESGKKIEFLKKEREQFFFAHFRVTNLLNQCIVNAHFEIYPDLVSPPPRTF